MIKAVLVPQNECAGTDISAVAVVAADLCVSVVIIVCDVIKEEYYV